MNLTKGTIAKYLLWFFPNVIKRLLCIDPQFNPLTAGAVYIRLFLHFLLVHYISAFKPVKDKNMTSITQQDLKFVDLHFNK